MTSRPSPKRLPEQQAKETQPDYVADNSQVGTTPQRTPTGTDPSVGQVALPTTAAAVTVPAAGVNMNPAYAKAVARLAYIWGWPMVNMLNRESAITKAPEPGR